MGAWRVLAVVLALKAGVLLLDSTVRLYLGDSAAYLAGAQDHRWLPTDRSFTYSLLLEGLVLPTGRLHVLLLWHALAGAGIAVMLWHLLVRYLGVPRRVAVGAACILALEPAQLYLERMVMAETFGLLAFAGGVAASCAYLASRRAAWLPVVALLGVSAVSLRMSYLPVVLVISAALPLLVLAAPGARAIGHVAVHLLLALSSVAVCHEGYRQAVGAWFDVAPTYLPRAGFMQMGLVAPLITSEHLARVGLPPDIERDLRYPLADRRARMAHMWAPGGLTQTLRRHGVAVEEVARPLSRMALAERPFALVPMGLDTVGDYFRPASIRHALDNDLGRREIPAEVLYELRERWGYHAEGLPTRVTPVSLWYQHTHWWLVACLLVLVPLGWLHLVLEWRTSCGPYVLLLALVGTGLVASHILFVNVSLFRYLQPLPFFVVAHTVALVTRRREPRSGRPPLT